MTLPDTADVIIVGGGILGLSAAWHLTRSHTDLRVLVLERNGLASAATAQAAALMTSARPDAATAALVADTYAAIPRLEDETGESLDLNRVGTLHVAASPASTAALAAMAGGAERLDGGQAARLAPWLDADAVTAAWFAPDDGYLDPARLANAYARAARRRGAVIRTGEAVRRLVVTAGRVTGVETDRGRVSAGAVVLACGAWSNVLAATAGVGLPAAPVRSEYWITDRSPLCPRTAPVTILPDAGAYARPELGALLFGLRGATTIAADPRTLPDDTTGFGAGDPWETLAAGAERLIRLVPSVGTIGLAHYVAGLSTYTPDGKFVVGPVAAVAGLVAVTGCCGAGIAASSGLGGAAAATVLGEPPPADLSAFDPGRFGTVDPFDPAFRNRCAAARSGKTTG